MITYMNDNKECENKYSLWLIGRPQSLDKDDVLSRVKVYIPPTVSISQDFSKIINYEWLIKTKVMFLPITINWLLIYYEEVEKDDMFGVPSVAL